MRNKISDGNLITLKNGLKIWTIPKPSKYCMAQDKVHLGVYIFSGINTESKKEIEYSHILEHLVAVLPSKKYPDSRENNNLMEKNGITAYGTVDDYKTHIWLEGLPKRFNLMFDMFVNGLLEFDVDDTIFDQEITAVLTELTDLLNNPFLNFEEYQSKSLFPNHSLSLPLTHHIDNTKKATPQKLKNYFHRLLNPQNMIIYISGKIKHNVLIDARETIKSIFSTLKRPKIPAFSMTKLMSYRPIRRKPPGVYFVKNDTPTTKVEWVWPIETTFNNKNVYIFETFESIIRDKMFDELRMNKGLIYNIKIDNNYDPTNKYLSFISISTDVVGKKVLLKTIQEFARIVDTLLSKITHDNILQHRRKLYRDYQDKYADCSVDSPLEVHIDNLLFTGKTISLESEMKNYLKVTLSDVRHIIKKYITLDKMYMFYSGKYKIL